MTSTHCRLYARSPEEQAPSLRETGPRKALEAEAEWLARASGEHGVLSVWVEDPAGEVLWSAGEKWTELHDSVAQPLPPGANP